jgi:hypothetical protein
MGISPELYEALNQEAFLPGLPGGLSPDGGENGDATGGAAPPAEAVPPPSDTTGQGEGEDGDAHGDGKEGRGERGSGRAEAGEGSEEAARHGAGGRNEAEGEHCDSDVRRTGAPGGVEGGQGDRPTDHGTVGAPSPPEGAPTSDDGMPWSPEIALPPPDVLVEPGDVAIGEGADPRGAPAVDGTSAPVTREGGSGPEQVGIKGGVGTFVPPAWLAWAIDTGLDVVQAGLDVVGLIPGFGEPADFANGVISLLRGDTAGALLSFAAIIPFAGWFAAGGKFTLRGLRLTGLFAGVATPARRFGDWASSAVRGRGSSRAWWNFFDNPSLTNAWPSRFISRRTVPGNVYPAWFEFWKRPGTTTVEFLGVPNVQGGYIWSSTDVITGSHVETLVEQLNRVAPGRLINIITGTHGSRAGYLEHARRFYVEDLDLMDMLPGQRFVDVHNIKDLTDLDLRRMVESNSEIILAWCNSENTRRIQRALGSNAGGLAF